MKKFKESHIDKIINQTHFYKENGQNIPRPAA